MPFHRNQRKNFYFFGKRFEEYCTLLNKEEQLGLMNFIFASLKVLKLNIFMLTWRLQKAQYWLQRVRRCHGSSAGQTIQSILFYLFYIAGSLATLTSMINLKSTFCTEFFAKKLSKNGGSSSQTPDHRWVISPGNIQLIFGIKFCIFEFL